jgi:cytochrome b subunit of formate dehydrogenase
MINFITKVFWTIVSLIFLLPIAGVVIIVLAIVFGVLKSAIVGN